MGTEGRLDCAAGGAYTLQVAFGSLSLPAGGLAVSGCPYPDAVSLAEGQSVTWHC